MTIGPLFSAALSGRAFPGARQSRPSSAAGTHAALTHPRRSPHIYLTDFLCFQRHASQAGPGAGRARRPNAAGRPRSSAPPAAAAAPGPRLPPAPSAPRGPGQTLGPRPRAPCHPHQFLCGAGANQPPPRIAARAAPACKARRHSPGRAPVRALR